jgi:hypothetical protein
MYLMPKSSMQSVKDIGQKLCRHRPDVMGLWGEAINIQFGGEAGTKDA